MGGANFDAGCARSGSTTCGQSTHSTRRTACTLLISKLVFTCGSAVTATAVVMAPVVTPITWTRGCQRPTDYPDRRGSSSGPWMCSRCRGALLRRRWRRHYQLQRRRHHQRRRYQLQRRLLSQHYQVWYMSQRGRGHHQLHCHRPTTSCKSSSKGSGLCTTN